MPEHKHTILLGIAAGLFTALMWGSWAVISRLGLTTGMDFHDVTALRFGVAGLVLAPVIVRAGVTRKGIGNVPWRAVLLMWLGAGVPYALIVFAGLGMAPASHQAIIGPSGVMLFTAGLSWLVLGERFDRIQLAGMAVIFGGVVTIGWHGFTGGAAIGSGHLLFVVAAVMWSVFTVAARAWRVDALLATAIVSVLSLVYLPVYVVFFSPGLATVPFTSVLMQAAFQGLLTGVVALIFYMRTVAALGAGRAALFTAVVPAMAAILAVPVLGERLTTATIAGALLVSAGMVIAVGRGAVGPGRAAAAAGQSAGLVPGSKPVVTARSQPPVFSAGITALPQGLAIAVGGASVYASGMGSGRETQDRGGFMQRLSAGLVAGIAVMTAVVIVLTAVSIVQDYRDALAETEAETQTVARALEQHSERVLDAIRFRLRLVQGRIGPPNWNELAADRDLHGELAVLADRPFIQSVWLFDETGLGRVSSLFFPALPSRVEDRDYFVAQRESDQGIYIGRSITGKNTGESVFSASIRLTHADGRFAGVAAIFIRPEYFQAFYRDLQLGGGGVIELLRADGAFLIREPFIRPLDDLNKSGDFLRQATGKASGTYRAVWPTDGVERIASFRKIVDLPVFVNVAMSADDALAGWRVSMLYRIALAMLALLATFAFGRLIVLRARAVESEVGRRTVELERSVREKEVLLREVHHRVKNNLQMIASMLRLTSRTSPRDSQPVLADIARRVTAIGQAYNQLYRVGQVSALNLAEYIDTVAQGVAAGFGSSRVTVRTELEQMTADIDTALPVGLVALELVTNAFKHAFAGGRGGEIVVKLQRHEGYARLVVSDNGVGLVRRGANGSGLMLIEALAGQVDGKLRTGPRYGGGTKARLTFKLVRGGPDDAARASEAA